MHDAQITLNMDGHTWKRITSLHGVKLFKRTRLLVAEVKDTEKGMALVGNNFLFFESSTKLVPSQWINPHFFIADRFGQAKHIVQDRAEGKVCIFRKA